MLASKLLCMHINWAEIPAVYLVSRERFPRDLMSVCTLHLCMYCTHVCARTLVRVVVCVRVLLVGVCACMPECELGRTSELL